MTEPVSCPYCNAYVAVAGPPGPGGRIACPRCGESFPLPKTAEGTPNGEAVRPAPISSVPAPDLSRGVRLTATRRTNSAIAGLILAIMAGMACVGLVLALMTKSERREHDTGLSRHPGRSVAPEQTIAITPVRTTAPADLPGLRYLPDDTQVVAGIHIAEAQQTEAGAQLLDLLGAGLKPVEQANGLTLDNLDSVVLGLKLREGGMDNALARLTIVIQTRVPYDPGAVRNQLRAMPLPETVHGKSIYPLNLPVPAALWCADERTLVVLLRFDGVRPSTEFDQLPPARPWPGAAEREASALLRERIAKGAQVWLVGHAEQADALVKLVPQRALSGRDRAALERVRSVAASVRADTDLTCIIAFACQDTAAARELQTRLDAWGLKGDRVKTVVQAAWVTVQLKTTPQEVRQAVERGIGRLLPAPGR